MKRINGKVPRVFCCIQTKLRADNFSIVHAEKGANNIQGTQKLSHHYLNINDYPDGNCIFSVHSNHLAFSTPNIFSRCFGTKTQTFLVR